MLVDIDAEVLNIISTLHAIDGIDCGAEATMLHHGIMTSECRLRHPEPHRSLE